MNSYLFETKDDRKNSLADDFRDVASNIWNLMQNGYKSKMNISEETITEIMLLELKLRHPDNIFIKQVGKKTEGKIGADWLWAFVGKDKNVFGICVQAKRLFQDGTYKNIIEEKSNPTKQVDKLIKVGSFYKNFTGKKLYPLYVFYNTWNEKLEKKADHFYPDCCEKDQPYTNLGCTYADAYDVRQQVLKSNNFLDDYANISHPLSCLIACHVNRSFPDLAKALSHRFVFNLKAQHTDLKEDDYLTTLYDAYNVRNLMFNDANDQFLIEMGIKGIVVIKQD